MRSTRSIHIEDTPKMRRGDPARVERHSSKRCFAFTTALPPRVAIWSLLLGTGLSGFGAISAPAQERVAIPLEYYWHTGTSEPPQRLGIWASINDGKAQRYIFDTGSDRFNTPIAPGTTGVENVPGSQPRTYVYGDGSYGYLTQEVRFGQLTYHDPEDRDDQSLNVTLPMIDMEEYRAARVLEMVYTEDHPAVTRGQTTFPDPVFIERGHSYYAGLVERELIRQGLPIEDGDPDAIARGEGMAWGTFGVGDFIFSTTTAGMFGSATRSGFVVAANSTASGPTDSTTPGCAPCAIVNLDSSLRAQFDTHVPWSVGSFPDDRYRDRFPGSGANASHGLEGAYSLDFPAPEGSNQANAFRIQNVRGLLDTGSPGSTLHINAEEFEELRQRGIAVPRHDHPDVYHVPSFAINPQMADGEAAQTSVDVEAGIMLVNDGDASYFVAGIDFFLAASVMYDLENQVTAFTDYFVSANDFSTDPGADAAIRLTRITPQMGLPAVQEDDAGHPVKDEDGNEIRFGKLGIAGVVSGSGGLEIADYAGVRMTGANTYSGATRIEEHGMLALVGPGSIENSSRVIVEGILDIQNKGNDNPLWGVSDDYNDARIRSLAGGGTVWLGDRALVLTHADDVFSGHLTDTDPDGTAAGHAEGRLTIAGGWQTLTGVSDFTGRTTIDAGAALTLGARGALASPVEVSGLFDNKGAVSGETVVLNGGMIAGDGRFTSLSMASGSTIAPGLTWDSNENPVPHALTIGGDFHQAAGSTYLVGTTADRIAVGGQAVIEEGARIELMRDDASRLTLDRRYALLSAEGGVVGTYHLAGNAYDTLPFIGAALAYDAGNVFLDVERSAVSFADVAVSGNQRSVAGAIEALGAGHAVHDDVVFLTEAEARTAMDLLSGEIHASARTALIEEGHVVRDAAGQRLRGAFARAGAPSAPVMAFTAGGVQSVAPSASEPVAWVHATRSQGHFNADGNAARLSRSSGGLLFGADADVEDWRLGVLAGYSNTSFNAREGRGEGSSSNYHVGVYAGTQRDRIGLRSGLTYSRHSIETERSVAFPGHASSTHEADYNGHTLQAFGEIGYQVETGQLAYEPYANLAYLRLKTGSFNEDGGVSALSGDGRSHSSFISTLGVRASSDIQIGTAPASVHGGIGWRHVHRYTVPAVSLELDGAEFLIHGAAIARNAALIELGMDVGLGTAAQLGLAYQGQLASGAKDHRINAELSVRF